MTESVVLIPSGANNLITEQIPIIVEIGDFKVAQNQTILQTISLGSCVGIVLYDSKSKIGGMAHIMLPDSRLSKIQASPKKFADTCIKLMIDEIIKLGVKKYNLISKIAGGACMFESALQSPTMNIGERNIKAVIQILSDEKIPIKVQDTGKNYGRTLLFHLDTGRVIVKSAKYGIKEI